MGRLGSGHRLVGQIGSGVQVSVSFQQKYPPGSVLRCATAAENGVMTKGVVSKWFDLRLRRITSSPSQTIPRPLVQRTATDAAVSARLDAFTLQFHTSRLVQFTTLQTCMQCMQRYSFRIAFFDYHTCVQHPRYGGSNQNIAIPFGMEKLK